MNKRMNQFFTTGKLTTTTGISTTRNSNNPTIELTRTSDLFVKLIVETAV
ncbi:hypothetical protein IMAU70168_01505 [Lactobacillus helveticus]|nr:hypothetical protein [Lactobacillus helveticus]